MKRISAQFLSLLAILVSFLFGTIIEACPNGCACIITGQVICNLAVLEFIPSDIPLSTKYLTLNENQIRKIPTDAFSQYKELKSLLLDHNNITDIAEYAFRGLSDMDEILIQKNPLDRLASFSFAGLKNVGRIYLGYNRITQIEAKAFFGSENVREVGLIGNPLTVLRAEAFNGFNNVQFFYFPKGIQQIEADTFNGLKNVSMLRLEGMKVTALESFAFRGLTNVAGFEIRISHIKTVQKGAFTGLANVHYFGLEDNTFEMVQNGAFTGMKNVDTVIVAKNIIEDVEENGLTGFNGSKRFNFTNNHIPCNCVLHRFVKGISKLTPHFLDGNVCHFPEAIRGQKASAVNLAELQPCPTVAPVTSTFDEPDQSLLNVRVSDVSNGNTGGSNRCVPSGILLVILLQILSFLKKSALR